VEAEGMVVTTGEVQGGSICNQEWTNWLVEGLCGCREIDRLVFVLH